MLTPAGPLSMHIEDVRIEVTEENEPQSQIGFSQSNSPIK